MALPYNLNRTIPISYSGMDNNLALISAAINGKQYPHNMSGDYTLQLEDCGKLFLWDSTYSGNITIPIQSSVDFPIGQHIDFVWLSGINDVTFIPDNGVTLYSQNNLTSIAELYVGVTLIKINGDVWLLIGNLK